MKIKAALAALTWLFLVLYSATASAALPKPEEIVKFAGVQFEQPLQAGKTSTLRIEAEVLPGWHINAHKPLDPDFIPTVLHILAPPFIGVGEVRYPKPELVAPQFSGGEKLALLSGTIEMVVPLTPTRNLKPDEMATLGAVLDYQACDEAECLRPATIKTGVEIASASAAAAGSRTIDTTGGAASGLDEAPPNLFEKNGIIIGLLLTLLGGIALNLTPCVYPLIGVTLAFFANQGGGTRRVATLAILYVLGIATMFSAVGVAAALSGGFFGEALQNPYVLLAIAALLLMLAASCFGFFSLQPPRWLMQRAGGARQGYLGAIGMGLGMGVVAAPCIGPFVVGLLLVVEQSQSILFGFTAFFALALGLGLPYIVLAHAAGSIRSMPRSGEWMGWVEQLFGFVLIGLALYFLDPLFLGRIMTRLLPFYGAAAGIYLGFFSRPGQALHYFRVFKHAVGLFALIAMIFFVIREPAAPISFQPYNSAVLARAENSKEPVIIDFSADWCIPCREMEESTFVDPAVKKEAARFIRMRADMTHYDEHARQLAKRYEIQGVPTTVLIDSKGSVRKRIAGYVGPEDYLKHLRLID